MAHVETTGLLMMKPLRSRALTATPVALVSRWLVRAEQWSW